MFLMHNQVIKITENEFKGIYRIILDNPLIGKTVLVQLDPDPNDQTKGGRKPLSKPKNKRKKQLPPNIGTLIWFDRSLLENYYDNNQLLFIEIERENKHQTKRKKTEEQLEKQENIFKRRKKAMEPFLSIDNLQKNIDPKRGITDLVKLAVKLSGLSKSNIYKLFSLLCRYGFSEKSLELNFQNCGAPLVSRPCEPGGRKKAGAKTTKQKIAMQQGIILEPDQPGMNTDWESLILAADKRIHSPKPPMPDRITQIIQSNFITRYRQDNNGVLIPIDPGLGNYPNRRQIKRVLEKRIPKLQQLLDKTTKGHFERSMRGMIGHSWENIGGPGHTWAIDSTIGDIYLRSSLNRAWIIGRPIVYIIVDVWSTAITGFYVCLQGPSWDMAKLALFCSGADPHLIGSLWGYQAVLSLSPTPTLCADLLCDRGEYLSIAAKQTGMQLLPGESYNPPYRPDLKGLVEVLHRIAKDKQYPFLPGAIDARRNEYELRKFNPYEAVFTVRDFVHYLHTIFSNYNLTADRKHRLDAHMKAEGVIGTPAGLWHWGHMAGIGMLRSVSLSELVTELLPSAEATVTRNGVMLGGQQYNSDIIKEEQWTAHSRNFGSWKVPASYFPGSVSTVWTPHVGQPGLIEFSISDQSTASPELTWDEIVDANEYYKMKNAEREHYRTMQNVASHNRVDDLVKTATRLTQEAIEREKGSIPSVTEARALENGLNTPDHSTACHGDVSCDPQSFDEAESTYLNAMQKLLESNNDRNTHG